MPGNKQSSSWHGPTAYAVRYLEEEEKNKKEEEKKKGSQEK
jgi:hypothetical protein